MNKKYTTLLFDLDDTLIDFIAAESKALLYLHQKFYTKFEFDLFKKTYQGINNQLWARVGNSVNHLYPGDVRFERFIQLNQELAVDISHLEIAESFEQYLGISTEWLPGIREAIELFHTNGYKLGIVTNGLTSVQYLKYNHHMLHKYFDCFIVSDEVGITKPNKEIFSLAFEALGLLADDLQQTLFVGDSLASDGHGAKNAGVDFAFINHKRIDVVNHQDRAVVKFNLQSVAQLPALLGHL